MARRDSHTTSHDPDQPEWVAPFIARYKKPYDFDANAWGTILHEISSINDREIIDALRWMQGPDQDWKKCETVKTLCMAIRTKRKADRIAQDSPDQHGDCAMCKDGWVTVAPEHGETITFDAFQMAYQVCCPCNCSRGQNLYSMESMKHYEQAQIENLRKLAQLGIKQQASMAA